MVDDRVMGKKTRSTWPRSLAGIAIVSLLFLQTCDRGPEEIPLAVLADQQESYRGEIVTTSGVVRRIGDSADDIHYVLEDEMSNRVELLPKGKAAAWVGQQVVATGRFDFRETRGRTLTIESIKSGMKPSALDSFRVFPR